MKAMILAAGLGTRMRPLTDHTPKPLLKAGSKTLIEWHIEKLAQNGISDIIINIAWLGWQIPAVLGDGSHWGIKLYYSDEQVEGALETAGGIVKALPLLGSEPFLVVNGDVWCTHDYRLPALQAHDLAHLVLVPNPPHHPTGDFVLDNGRISREEGLARYTFSGIGLYHPALFADLDYGKRPLLPILLHAIAQQRLSGELFSGDWRDIGTPERLQELDRELKTHTNFRN